MDKKQRIIINILAIFLTVLVLIFIYNGAVWAGNATMEIYDQLGFWKTIWALVIGYGVVGVFCFIMSTIDKWVKK